MNNLTNIISKFSSITLDEMDGVKLMSRTDTKFAFKVDQLPLLLKKILPFYRVLYINDKSVQEYKSLYFDTSDRKFFLDHHNRRVNRNKIRFRKYVGSNLTFLEVKTKNNKGKTIKKRIKVDTISDKLTSKQENFIDKILGKELDIESKQWINFSRITLVHKVQTERLTIDIDLTFEYQKRSGDLKHLVIAEVKQERMSRSSDFMRIAKELHILPIRISKYCMSAIELNPDLKQNRFKQKKIFINKLKLA